MKVLGNSFTLQAKARDGQDIRENLIDNSEPPFLFNIADHSGEIVGTNTDKTYSSAKIPPSGTVMSGQCRLTLTDCVFNGEASIYMEFTNGTRYPSIIGYFRVSENGTYEVRHEGWTLGYTEASPWSGTVNIRVRNIASGTVSVERVKLEVGKKCSAWCLSENDKKGASITKISETYRYATNNTGVRPDASSSAWQSTKPALQKGYWLFTETTITWSDGSTTVLYTAERNPNDGDGAVTYQIVFTEAWARVDNSNIITARLRGYAYKIEGTTRTPLNGAMIRYGYILTNSSTYADTTTIPSGYFSEDNWFNGDVYGDSGYVQGSKTVFAAIIINNEVMCVEHVLLVKDAAPGQTGSAGKMCYIAGTYDPLQTYTSNASETVAVEVENSNGVVELWKLVALTNVVNGVHVAPTDANQSVWQQCLNSYNLIRAKYLFADFAQLGSFIVSQDFFLSQYGTLMGFGGVIQVTSSRTVGKVYMKTVNGKQVPYYACGSSASGDKPCYLFFDAGNPMAENVQNGPTFTIEGKGVANAVIVRRVYFRATADTTVEISLTPSSEAGYDWGAVGKLDSTALSASGVSYDSVGEGTTPTLLKASGTATKMQTVSVAAGWHFFEIAYLKDSITNSNSDKATFIFAEASNNGYISGFSMLAFRPTKVVNALTGEEWMAQGNMNVSPDGDVMVKGKLVMTSLTVQLADITLWGTSNMFVVGVDTVVGGNSIGGIWNFKCGNNQTIFLPTNRYYYLGQRVILYNSSPNLGGGNGTFVICGDIDEYDMTTEHEFRGVGLFPSYSTPPTPMQLNTYDAVTKIMFFNGILELMCVPSSQDGSTCEWCVTNIGTMFYNFYTT